MTFDDDRCPIRTAVAPQAVASCRNLVIVLVRRTGHRYVAAAMHTFAGRPFTAIAIVGSVVMK